MVMDEDPIAAAEIAHGRAGFFDHTHRFMAEDQGRLAPDVPGHDVARANAARAGANEHISGPNFGTGARFDADVAEIVKACDLH
jgi:hypothetical protein